MSSALQALRDGNLDQALSELQQKIRSDPSNAADRVFLFQLLAVMGQWDRALNQLNVAAEMDPGALAMAQMYREALRLESLRHEVFEGRRTPFVFGQPPQWIGWLIEALRLTAAGEDGPAQQLRDRALEEAPVTSGEIDGAPFEWLCDMDSRLGPVIEGIVNGQYYWIPIQNIATIVIEEPEDLRDVVWAPAHFRWSNGGETVGLIPTRYPGTHGHADDQLRMARKTEWVERPGDAWLGLGQRMFAAPDGEHSLLDIRKITFDTLAIEPEDAGPVIGDADG